MRRQICQCCSQYGMEGIEVHAVGRALCEVFHAHKAAAAHEQSTEPVIRNTLREKKKNTTSRAKLN